MAQPVQRQKTKKPFSTGSVEREAFGVYRKEMLPKFLFQSRVIFTNHCFGLILCFAEECILLTSFIFSSSMESYEGSFYHFSDSSLQYCRARVWLRSLSSSRFVSACVTRLRRDAAGNRFMAIFRVLVDMQNISKILETFKNWGDGVLYLA